MTDDKKLTKSEAARIYAEAETRFKRCMDWESAFRKRFVEDVKFAEADSDNGWQWPNEILTERLQKKSPSLTINKIRQHNLQIINDAKQNKPMVKIRAVSNGASVEAAKIYEAIVRHIEYQSNAPSVYDTATEYQVKGGIGYFRVDTDYVDDESFDQEIFIRRVQNPLGVYLDPDAKEADKSDAEFGFFFEQVAKDEFDAKYPRYAGKASQDPLGAGDSWVMKDNVRVCEYFRRVEVRDMLLSIPDGIDGIPKGIIKKSLLPKELLDLVKDLPGVEMRPISTPKVEWFFIVGREVMERREWAGKYIPIVPVIGEETIIDGTLDRKGHTRNLKDPQRMYNYWASAAVEHVALQGKTPWVAPVAAIEGVETYWNTANVVNHSVLPWNHVDENGQPIPAPQRPEPPQMAPAYLQGLQLSQVDMMAASGQYEQQFGQPGNERTGAAISQRQRKGDLATFHFIDNLTVAVRHLGRILLDLIPKIYDTRRIVLILAEDGTSQQVTIDPAQREAFVTRKMGQMQQVEKIFNPNVGKYEVLADSGPGYATRRQEAFNAFTQIITQAPMLTQLIGDLVLTAGDFPLADEAAARMKRMVPKEALGEGPSQKEQELAVQVESLTGLVKVLSDELTESKIRGLSRDAKSSVQAYDAETRRLAAAGKILHDQGQFVQDAQQLMTQAQADAASNNMDELEAASVEGLRTKAGLGEQMELPLGADSRPQQQPRQAPDGNWYVPDPQRPGKYLMVQNGQ